MYRQRRLVEAGLPSGTFSTADDALMQRDGIGAPDGSKRLAWLMVELAKLEHEGFIERFPNGCYGATVM